MSPSSARSMLAKGLCSLAAMLDTGVQRDQLTGLANRTELMRHLRRVLARGVDAAILYVDLDDFKLVNDTLGHAAGDDLLRHVAVTMSELVGPGDLLARQGGDEFVLVVADSFGAAAVAERLREAITAHVTLRGVEISVGVSIGIATRSAAGGDAAELLDAADAAMYDAKLTGRNQISHGATLDRRNRAGNREALELTATLPEAIARDELLLHWQPIVDIHDETILGLEALVRWQHPHRGLLLPGAFLPFAAQTGMISAVDEWVAGALTRQRILWRSEGLDPYVGFNLAPQFARRPGALQALLSRLTVGGLSLDHITVELTESEALREDHRLAGFLDGLHQAGVTVSLDDFGRAYSSLDRLRDVPARWIKLDRAFTERVAQDKAATDVLIAILELLRALELEIIVEGIERPEQLELLRRYGGVRAAQGFLLGRPVLAGELRERLLASPPSRMPEPAQAGA